VYVTPLPPIVESLDEIETEVGVADACSGTRAAVIAIAQDNTIVMNLARSLVMFASSSHPARTAMIASLGLCSIDQACRPLETSKRSNRGKPS
jgi:hypothetical protein